MKHLPESSDREHGEAPSSPSVNEDVIPDLTYSSLHLAADQESGPANVRDHRLVDDTYMCHLAHPDQRIRLAELTSDPIGRSLTMNGYWVRCESSCTQACAGA